MKEFRNKDGVFFTTAAFGPDPSDERVIHAHGHRFVGPNAYEEYILARIVGPTGQVMSEFETIETRASIDGLPRPDRPDPSTKVVVRHYPQLAVRLPLSTRAQDPRGDLIVMAVLTEFGETLYGGPADNPREPWAHFQIDDPGDLQRAFGQLNGEGRRPNATGSYVKIVVPDEAPPTATLMMGHRRVVNEREMTFTRARKISIDYGPDTTDGRVGPILKATVGGVRWTWGNPDQPLGLMA